LFADNPTVKTPSVLGVPEITPVLVFRVNPGASDPLTIPKEVGVATEAEGAVVI
jgi:hypothetical protein